MLKKLTEKTRLHARTDRQYKPKDGKSKTE